MSVPLPVNPQPQPQDAPVVCRLLRTKMAYANYGSARAPWQEGKSNTAVFWCLATMETAGPDDQFAHPQSCCAGRACYQAPVE